MKKDAVEEQKHKLNTMELTDDELAILAKARKNIGAIGIGGTLLGALGGYAMTQGNQSGRLLRAFVIGSTMVAGAALGFGLGIQGSMDMISKEQGNLAEELKTYQQLISKSRKAGGTVNEDTEFETHFVKEILNKRITDPTAPAGPSKSTTMN